MNTHTQKLTLSVSDIQNQLLEISNTLDVTECNAQFTNKLAEFVQEHIHKPLDQLTIAELIDIVTLCRKAFNEGTEPEIESLTISPTKHHSLKKQHEIIGHALGILSLSNTQESRLAAAQDTIELVRMLQDLPKDLNKTSRFNVINKARQLIAERIPFEQAIQYQNCIVKFACMEVAQ